MCCPAAWQCFGAFVERETVVANLNKNREKPSGADETSAITLSLGTNSEIISTRLGVRSRLLTPVRLLPGRARLATRPRSTGSPLEKRPRFLPPMPEDIRRSPRSHRPCARPDRRPIRAADRSGSPPSGIRLPHSVPRPSRYPQTLEERGHIRCSRNGRGTAEEADDRHHLLLSAGCVRSNYSATQQQEQLAAVHHSITSSARSRIEGGIVRPSALAVFRLTTSWNLVGC